MNPFTGPRETTVQKAADLLDKIKYMIDLGHTPEAAYTAAMSDLELTKTWYGVRKDVLALDYRTNAYKEHASEIAAKFSEYVRNINAPSKLKRKMSQEYPATPEEAMQIPTPPAPESRKVVQNGKEVMTGVLDLFRSIEQEMAAKDQQIESLKAQVAALKRSNEEFESIVLNFSAAWESMSAVMAECTTKNNRI